MKSIQRKFLLLSQGFSANILPTLFLFLPLTQNLFGQNWMKITPSFANGDTLLARANLIFVTKNVGWIITSGSTNHPPTEFATKIFKTIDGGYHWELQKELGKYSSLYALFALDSLRCWALGQAGDVIYTNDGGISWDTIGIIDARSSITEFTALHFFNGQEGIAFNAYRWLTIDGGKNWTRGDTTNGVFSVPVDVHFANRNIGWIVGAGNPSVTDAGFIAKTTDGGNIWKYQDHFYSAPYTPIMAGVDFLDSLNGFAVGNNVRFSSGYILPTKNGGDQWERKQLIGSGVFYDVGFLDRNLGWITSGAGRIWRTTDGGATWNLQNTGFNARLGKIIILRKEKSAFIFGDNQYEPPYTLLRSDLSPGLDESENVIEMPKKFSLFQNYPNPFNSQTIIEYTVEKTSPIQLQVFDLLGKEVKTLINQNQSPGRYKVIWDGTTDDGLSASSGIYIYRLTAGDSKEYRKMIFAE